MCDKTLRLTTVSQRFGKWFAVFLLAVAGIAGTVAYAQLSGTGAISGTVQDPSGAVIPNATVTATDVATNVSTVRHTTKAGDYNITPLIPGTYAVTVTAQGFQGYKQENITVDALVTVGLNVKMAVGRADETVTITAAPPLLHTTDATLGAVMDNEMYSNLPLQMSQGGPGTADQRRATDFATLMPGVSNVYGSGNSTDASTGVNGSGPAGGVQEIYIEGVDLPEADGIGDPRFTWTAIGVDAVNQFQVQTAGVSSQFAGQGVQNYSIKSGGNAIHGSLYEYNRNTLFDAWAFTSKIPTTNSKGVKVAGGIKPREIQNEFGLVLSGPIIKNKLFLFGNYGQYREQHGATYNQYTIPTSLMLGMNQSGTPLGYADFTQYAQASGAGAAACTSASLEGTGGVPTGKGCLDIYDPSTEGLNCLGTAASPCSRTIFHGMLNGIDQNDVIPGSRLSQAATAINKFWIPYEQVTNQNSYSNNLAAGLPTGLANWYSTGRIDYNQSARNQVALIIAFGRQASTGLSSTSGLGVPFNAAQDYHPVTNIDILKDVFTINSHMVNQAAIGFGRYESVSVTQNDAPPYTAAALGLLGTPPGQASSGFPAIAGVASATLGGYAWNSKVNNTYTVTDNLQWVFGKHNLTLGGQDVAVQFNLYKALGPTGPMSYTFSGSQTAGFTPANSSGVTGTSLLSGTGNATASYMIGAVSSDSVSDLNIPGLGTRWNDPSFWVQDDYKVTNKLTLNLGLRWDISPSIQEAHNLFSFLNPNGINSITGNKGTLEFAGNGNSSLYCNCKSPTSTYFGNIGPRIGMAYSVNPKTVIRGSYTVNFARGDWTSGSQNGSPSTTGFAPTGSNPIITTPDFPQIYWDATACTNGTNAGVNCGFNGSVTAPAVPVGGTSLAEFGTGNYATTVAGKTTNSSSGAGTIWFDQYKGARTPEFINWTFGLERQVTRDISLSVSYLGSQGHFIGGGFSPLNHRNALPTSFAALAGYTVVGTTAVPCSGINGCTSNDLLTAKAPAIDVPLFQSLGFQPQNPYVASGISYPSTSTATGYMTAFPQYGVSDSTNFNGNTNFHALEIVLRDRPSHGVDFSLSYTYSKSMDDVGTFRLVDNPRLDRSLSTTDQPQNITGTVVYQSPYGRGKKGGENFLVRALVSDWSVSSIVTYHSGLPVAFTGSGCAGTPMGQCMPSVVPGVNARTLSYANPPGGVTANPSASNYFGGVHHLNINAFTVLQASATVPSLNAQQIPVGFGTAAYVPGNAARVGADNVWGMGTYNIDLGLKRSFPIWENVKLQFEADLLNATNHVVFGSPSGAVASGNSTIGANGTFSGSSTYGTVTSVTNQPRDMQLSGRINW